MYKQSLTTLVLCLCFGTFSCTSKSSGRLADQSDPGATPNPGVGNPGSSTLGTLTRGGGESDVIPGRTAANEKAADTQVNASPLVPGGPPPEPVPEPMTMLLFGSGLAGLAYRYRRRNEAEETAEETVEA
jgi:hypothetical protein